MSSKVYHELFQGSTLAPTSVQLFLANGEIRLPRGVLVNQEVTIAGNTIHVDFYVLDGDHSTVEYIILGILFSIWLMVF